MTFFPFIFDLLEISLCHYIFVFFGNINPFWNCLLILLTLYIPPFRIIRHPFIIIALLFADSKWIEFSCLCISILYRVGIHYVFFVAYFFALCITRRIFDMNTFNYTIIVDVSVEKSILAELFTKPFGFEMIALYWYPTQLLSEMLFTCGELNLVFSTNLILIKH